MYIKISLKADTGEKADYGYQLMTEAFRDLVFCSNLAGYSTGGDYCVIQVGGLFDEGLEAIRQAIMEIWGRGEYQYQPDDLLSLEIAKTMLG